MCSSPCSSKASGSRSRPRSAITPTSAVASRAQRLPFDEIYAEGLRIPPLKFYEEHKRNETIVQIIERNVRVPVRVFGDLRAQLSACHIAERQILELVARYGRAGVQRHMHDLLDYSERMTRAALHALPDGTFSFEDWIDDDGIDVGRPIRLLCTITKADDRITVDWTGTSPRSRAPSTTLSPSPRRRATLR